MEHLMLAGMVRLLLADVIPVCGFAAACVALCGWMPARKGKMEHTLLFIAPALIWSVGLGWCFVMEGLALPDWKLREIVVVWVVTAGPATGASLIVLAVLVVNRIAMGKQEGLKSE